MEPLLGIMEVPGTVCYLLFQLERILLQVLFSCSALGNIPDNGGNGDALFIFLCCVGYF